MNRERKKKRSQKKRDERKNIYENAEEKKLPVATILLIPVSSGRI